MRNQLITDGASTESATIQKLIAEANEPLTRSANFSAIHAAATLAFVLEWAMDEFKRQDDMPEKRLAGWQNMSWQNH